MGGRPFETSVYSTQGTFEERCTGFVNVIKAHKLVCLAVSTVVAHIVSLSTILSQVKL